MKLANLRWIVPVIVTVFLSGPAFAAAGLPTATSPAGRTAPSAPVTPSAPASPAASATALAGQIESYAQRERQAPNLQNFKGGVGVYIGGSALVLVLLIILLLVLI
jgi:hypothetical protein